jgi:type I restriction enzyme S subunit
LSEQRDLVTFLDRETGKIDALVAEQERLMALLKEKRQAVISQAVTKGLDPNVPMKDSGVEWLGEVPESWQLMRAKFLFRKSERPIEAEAEIVTCFRNGEVTLRRNRREDGFTNAVLEVGYQWIVPGQLVLHSMDAFAGAIGVSDSAGKCSPEYIICDPISDSVYNPYYGLLLRMMALRGFILATCPSVRERAPRIRFPDFGDMLLPVPPVNDQKAIMSIVNAENARSDALWSETDQAIALLKERRAALISAAVTGKIDVRGLVGGQAQAA